MLTLKLSSGWRKKEEATLQVGETAIASNKRIPLLAVFMWYAVLLMYYYYQSSTGAVVAAIA